MKSVLHKAESRGHANHGWLDTYHTFSFSSYHNPERMHFGVLRVLNDDVVAAGMGFGTHPHNNMEIISIPLRGALEHKDSMGNTHVIRKGDVQTMSAGTGVTHSEYNHSKTEDVNFLQIWLMPKKHNIKPAYEQVTFHESGRLNTWQTVVSPEAGGTARVNQDAWFSLAKLQKGHAEEYFIMRKGNGAYLFVLEGKVSVAGHTLSRRDGLGLWDLETLTVEGLEDAEVLLMDIPMSL